MVVSECALHQPLSLLAIAWLLEHALCHRWPRRLSRPLCLVGVSLADQGFVGKRSKSQPARRTRVLPRRNALS